MSRRALTAGILFAFLSTALLAQSLPTPETFFGFPIGAEKKLARWDKIVEYMRLADRASDRIILREPGKTTDGNPFLLMIISSPRNLRALDRYQGLNRKIFDPRTVTSAAESARLAGEGKIFVLITCSIHASEVGATQMSVEAVHRLATDNSPETLKILDNVVLLLVPCLNPDGQIMVTDWYNKTLGTPYENSPMPWLYQRYTGHDNNRDAFMFTQVETRLLGKILYEDWFPEVWLDMHQMGGSGARLFVMPANDPINPNVDPLIYRYAGILGYSQAAALERAGKTGIITADTYTYWWEGAMGWTGWWHNMIGMLTEAASVRTATSVEQETADPKAAPAPAAERGGRGGRGEGRDPSRPMPAPRDIQFRSAYQRPWLGGRWTLRDIVDYDFIAAFGLLETAADMRIQILKSIQTACQNQVEAGRKGDPFAVIVPASQHDGPTAVKMLQTLALGGVEVHRAAKAFAADGRNFQAGDYVILMAQPFRAYAKDMLEAQDYPKIVPAPGMQPQPPYDAAGWSLGMQMGVETVFVKEPFKADLEKMAKIAVPAGKVTGSGPVFILGHEANDSLVAVNRLLKEGAEISWLRERFEADGEAYAPGAIVVSGGASLPGLVAKVIGDLGLRACSLPAVPDVPAMKIRPPRLGLYQPWGGNMDEGWTRWILEQYEFPFRTLHPEDIREKGALKDLDAVVFPDMGLSQILAGQMGANIMPEYKGGIADEGFQALKDFVEGGGTVITLGRSTQLAIDRFGAPFRDALRGLNREAFFCPGSVLRVAVDNTVPIAYGMPAEADAYFSNSMVLDAAPAFEAPPSAVALMFPKDRILRSGWLQGESYIAGKVGAAEVRIGKGRLVLLPLRVQNRAQTHGTFKLLFNALLISAAK